ncbi:MAG: helix-turn-helix transcriptional regulator [Beijerinckiaceae bacterium]|nr:helix-turn-helix transcriptional regulator [Beijerinckiaceae bacterium]
MLPITALTAEDGGLCPIRQILAKVMGKWQSLILLSLEDGPQRFSSVKRLIGDITQRVLTENLRDLERDGYITRDVRPGPPVEVHYQLTALGEDLVVRFKLLVSWAADHYDRITANRQAYDART